MSGKINVLTVTLNPAVDKVAKVSTLKPGSQINISHLIAMAGGKGINVSRTLNVLGYRSLATGFAGGSTGQSLLREMLLEGIEHNFVFIKGETRINLTLQDAMNGQVTRILEPGPVIEEKDLVNFRRKFDRLTGQSDLVVICGRSIRGAPVDFYTELARTAKKRGAQVFVDASSPDLACALEGKPFFVKPNLQEAESLLRGDISSLKKLKYALRVISSMGAQNVAITLGRSGSVATDGKKFFLVRGPCVPSGNTVGCGDVYMAGLVYAFSQKSVFADGLAYAAACAAANLHSLVPGRVDPARTAGLLGQIKVREF